MINVGDIVSRNKYDNDILFKVIEIENDIYYLKGISIRLYADALAEDIKKEEKKEEKDDEILRNLDLNLDRSEYFYIPGKILHIDADKDYLNRCLKFYKSANINATGVLDEEETVYLNINKYLNDIRPDIVIITGHDAYYEKKGKKDNLKNYKNSENFEKAVISARNYEKSYEKLKIIAGACQSDYEDLIKAGANFASSPKRVNIHALDPAIIATSIAMTPNTEELDLITLLDKTKCKKDGIGGIKTHGSMFIGYPR